jgi:hypothetical protein
MVYNDYENCPICLEEINDLLITPCKHKFCKNCIDEWIKIKCECPLCRTKLISSNKIIPSNLISSYEHFYVTNSYYETLYVPNYILNDLLISSGNTGLSYSQ